MRHHVIVIVGFIAMHVFAGNATAQITLNASNTPKAEYKYAFQKIQFNYSDLFHAGADTVWNISSAVFTGDTSFIHYTQDTAFDPFPSCGMTNELHEYLNNLDNSFIQTKGLVYQKTDTAFLVAFEKNSNQYTSCFVLDNHYYPVMTFPLEYETVLHKPANMHANHVLFEKEGDAWGTLICADTTYNNVLRVVTVDSISYIPSTSPSTVNAKYTTFEWFSLESELPILSLKITHYVYWHHFYGSSVIIDTTALLYQSKTYLPLDTPFHVIVPENSIVIYPNPATNTIAIEGNDSISELIIYNTSGFAVMHFNQITTGKKVRVNISTLSKGLYIAAGKFTSGVSFRKKFIVTED